MKRVIIYFLLFSMIFTSNIYAEDSNSMSQKKIMIYMKPDVTVKFNDVDQDFWNAQGKVVYPIIYNGSAYLPIRSISRLMNEPIEWDGASKTVYIGRTLSDPNKETAELSSSDAKPVIFANSGKPLKAELVSAYLKPDVMVMYDFAIQTFKDVNRKPVYPIIYNGSTYLPIRAVAELMKEPIEWDGNAKIIAIGDGEEMQEESDTVGNESEISLAAKSLNSFFEREEIIYYEATGKTTSLKETVSLEEKMLIAAAISENYLNAQKLTAEIKAMNLSRLTDEETEAYNKVVAFAESTEYYILVLENIAYLAAQDTDYSMLAETFLYFAMDSQESMEEARVLVQEINQ